MDRLTVVKIGGAILEDPRLFERFCKLFALRPGKKILVHGGGPQADRIGRRLGVEPRMHEGRRITDDGTLEVVTMVYAGLNAKQIVARLQERGCNALSLAGPDGRLMVAERRPVGSVDYGSVGDLTPEGVNTSILRLLIDEGFVPVLGPITFDGKGELLNTNADTIASAVAVALRRDYLVDLLTIMEAPGLLSDRTDPTSLIATTTPSEIERMRNEGRIAGGMIPKIQNSLTALEGGVESIRMGTLAILEEPKAGTTLLRN